MFNKLRKPAVSTFALALLLIMTLSEANEQALVLGYENKALK